MPWAVTSFYRFTLFDPEDCFRHREAILAWMLENGFVGLVLLAPEGINGTVAGPPALIPAFKAFLTQETSEMSYKDSECEDAPFRGTRVEIRNEIVGMKRPDLAPEGDEGTHLDPKEWHAMLESGQELTLIDTRNRYETRLGMFRGAIDPNLSHFSHWAEYADRAEIPRDRPVLIYCTGGIRCEKVAVDLKNRGFEKVFQLRDGILGYLAEFPNGRYEGECFVFDERVAVDGNLQPTVRFGICPACGEPSESQSPCKWCQSESFVCDRCRPSWGSVCSKTCRDRVQRHGTSGA